MARTDIRAVPDPSLEPPDLPAEGIEWHKALDVDADARGSGQDGEHRETFAGAQLTTRAATAPSTTVARTKVGTRARGRLS